MMKLNADQKLHVIGQKGLVGGGSQNDINIREVVLKLREAIIILFEKSNYLWTSDP